MPQEDDAKFQMAPMIDMVFLLLVFFMCASRLSQMQNKELEIPTATKAVVPKERPDRFVVNVTKTGEAYAGDRAVGDMQSLKDLVTQFKAEFPDARVYLRADRETPHKYVRTVMSAMAESGIDDFIFGAFIPGESSP
jgi:biopolymer transport protein ExbD